jgi:hypothetical protein
MYHNDFSVRIPEGHEVSGYVELKHNTSYTIAINNRRSVRCDAAVEIDGKHVGTFRLNAFQAIRLERPDHDTGLFTFYHIGSAEGNKIGLSKGDPNLGLVKVTFTPEKKPAAVYRPRQTAWRMSDANLYNGPTYRGDVVLDSHPVSASLGQAASAPTSYNAGGTGLSGKSNQEFTTTAPLDYDYSQETTIYLRLVEPRNSDEPRPLTSSSTPIPPAVE